MITQTTVTIWMQLNNTEDYYRAAENENKWQQPFRLTTPKYCFFHPRSNFVPNDKIVLLPVRCDEVREAGSSSGLEYT